MFEAMNNNYIEESFVIPVKRISFRKIQIDSLVKGVIMVITLWGSSEGFKTIIAWLFFSDDLFVGKNFQV